MELLIFIAVFIGVIAVTALLFGGWAIVMVIKALASGVQSLVAPPRPTPRLTPPPGPLRCMRPRCHGENPAGARFCRRCGAGLTAGATPPLARLVPSPLNSVGREGPVRAPAMPGVSEMAEHRRAV